MATTDRGEQKRAIVEAFDHDTTYLLQLAATAAAGMFEEVDQLYPSPEMRADALTLRRTAELLREANGARPFLEGDK